ncbi:MAG: YkgJ family cysteine cluster protein [Planctomycetaceae bacterium]|jgi:Fe-S-cluster containining protein|nr:YkgJ family cysteine cluster protein [Planctomycetaceae bacterium]
MSSEFWYKDGLRFSCKGCGRCCCGEPGYVWVTTAEINQMAKKLGISAIRFEDAFVWTVQGRKRSLREFPNGDCVLFNEKSHGCKVYEDRPAQCRTWPFWTQNIDSRKSWEKTAKFCPGCNQGKTYSLEEIEEQKNKMNFF